MGITNTEKEKLFKSILYPGVFVIILWLVKVTEVIFDISFIKYGLYPRTYSGLIGVLTSPLIHGSFNHLMSNTVPLLVLGGIIFYFYRPIAFSVFFWVYFMSGIWLWAAGRDAYHIGASGLVYGFVTFLFFSGIFRKERKFMVLSLLVTFLYGSLIWGIFPLEPQVSWESHLLGSLAGISTAYYYRNEYAKPDEPKSEGGDDDPGHDEWKLPDNMDSTY